MRQAVVFDLDGTLTQSEEGIFNSIRYVAERMGYPVPDAEELRKFIGPPLHYSFVNFMGMNDTQAVEAVRVYRERYVTTGLFENRVYPGIRRLLRTLKANDVFVAVATGKPQSPSERILEHFGLSHFIDRVVGPDMDTKDADKEKLIRKALPEHYDHACMVGDRKFDIEGAKRAGIGSVGVGYGYGSREELEQAGCNIYAETVEDLIQALCAGMPVPRGQFLSMEGLDGSGKSTQLTMLKDHLSRYGYELVESREPGGCPISEKIRTLILSRENAEMTAQTEALLYAASRAQHVHDVILPAVRDGKLMICDRFLDSSVAYQGGGRGLGVEEVVAMNTYAVGTLRPDVTVFLFFSHEVALSRRMHATTPDRMEIAGEAFHARVEDAYHAMISREPERFVVVDASGDVQTIAKTVAERVIERLKEME